MSFQKKAFQPVPTVSRAFSALPEPECIKDNRGLLGTLNYVRRFIDGYAEITAPLVELTRKYYVKKTAFKKAFGPAQREAFLARSMPYLLRRSVNIQILLGNLLSIPMRHKQV